MKPKSQQSKNIEYPYLALKRNTTKCECPLMAAKKTATKSNAEE
jgi:hypothetical protein